jgi:hypothetical protein
MVVPAFTALLADAAVKVLGDSGPFDSSILGDQLEHGSVFFFGPGALDQARIQDLLPAMQALDVSAPREIFSDLFPVLLVVADHCVSQEQVLHLGPVSFSRSILILGWANFVQMRIFLLPFSDGL